MWGICGQIEEQTKLAAWLAFDRMRKKLWFPDAVEEIDITGLSLLFPRNKKQAFQSMVKNADDTGWILPYQFQRSFALPSHTRMCNVAIQPQNGEGAIDPYCVDRRNKTQVSRDSRGLALHDNLHDDQLLGDRPHGRHRRVRQLSACLVPTRDSAQYACRDYYGNPPCSPEEVSEVFSGMEYDHCTEQ